MHSKSSRLFQLRVSAFFLLSFLLLIPARVLYAAPDLTGGEPIRPLIVQTQTFTQIGSGSYHTCGLTEDGGVKCWGQNYFGHLGNGTWIDQSAPVAVSGLTSGVKAIHTGTNHSCALLIDGTARCWGANFNGQLGNGTTEHSNAPVVVSGVTGAIAIGGGENHVCVIDGAGALKCWGANGGGQLGDATTTNRTTPVIVSGLAGPAQQVSGGRNHTCAILQNGTVQCWGDNVDGQLGNNNKPVDSTVPVNVLGLSGAAARMTGTYNSSCALLQSGKIQCWGFMFGTVATNVAGWETGMSDVALGGLLNRCAVTQSGTVFCAGPFNDGGQLGNGTTVPTNDPLPVVGIDLGASHVVMGSASACALVNGQVRCWGENTFGQLGIGQPTRRTIPLDVAALVSTFTQVSAGGTHTCAVTGIGGAQCWGESGRGQLGNNTRTYSSLPVDVSGLASGVKQVSTGNEHSCALTVSGGVKCWGYNRSGQLGIGSELFQSLVPVDVSGLASGVKSVAAGGYFTCALMETGGVKCWGENLSGSLGIGSTVQSRIPVDVTGLSSNVVMLSAGLRHVCALLNSGHVKCWGGNYAGAIGDGTSGTDRTTPVDVQGLSNVKSIAAGGYHTCALLENGGVKCWGDNRGAIGDGTTDTRLLPVDVIGMTGNVQAVTAGSGYTCALTDGGAVMCWGMNYSGQIGNGTLENTVTATTTLSLEAGVTALSAGSGHACALLNSGAIRCWGSDGYGELGIGSQARRYSATPVVDNLPSEIFVNHTTGKPGSFFTITGFGFAPDGIGTLSANGTNIGTALPNSASGSFVVQLDTTGADTGKYSLSVASPGLATQTETELASLILDESAPLYTQEGSAQSTRILPPGIAQVLQKLFIPIVQR